MTGMRALSLALILGALSSRPAVAQVAAAGVTILGLDAREAEGQLLVAYAIEPESWGTLVAAGIQPILNVRTEAGTVSQALGAPEGELLMPLPPTTTAFMWFSGSSATARIAWVEVGGSALTGVSIPVTPEAAPGVAAGQLPPEASWAQVPEVVAACDDVFDGTLVSSCLALVAAAPVDPTPTIRACAAQVTGDQAQIACVRALAGSPWEVTPTILACLDLAAGGEAYATECLASAGRAPWDPRDLIATCDVSMTGDQGALQCVALASRSPVEASGTVSGCGASYGTDQERLECLGVALGLAW